MNRNAESLYLCGLPAFVLSNGSSLALFVGRVIYNRIYILYSELSWLSEFPNRMVGWRMNEEYDAIMGGIKDKKEKQI